MQNVLVMSFGWGSQNQKAPGISCTLLQMLILGEGLTLWLDLLLSYWEKAFSNELSFSLNILLFDLLAIWIQGQSVTCFLWCDIYYKHSKCIWLISEERQVWLYGCYYITESLSWGIFSEYIMQYIKSWKYLDSDILAQYMQANPEVCIGLNS